VIQAPKHQSTRRLSDFSFSFRSATQNASRVLVLCATRSFVGETGRRNQLKIMGRGNRPGRVQISSWRRRRYLRGRRLMDDTHGYNTISCSTQEALGRLLIFDEWVIKCDVISLLPNFHTADAMLRFSSDHYSQTACVNEVSMK